MTTATPPCTIRPAICLLAIPAASGCSQFTVRADRNPAADFARYRTFAWMAIAEARPGDQTTGHRGIDDRIYTDIEREMQRHGYAPGANADADLLLTFRLLKDARYDDADVTYGAQWHHGVYLDALHASPDAYDRGTLMVDVVDRTQNLLVWRGSAASRLLPHFSYERRVKRASDAVKKIFAKFPTAG